MMSNLQKLNQLAQKLNRAVNVQAVLDDALATVIEMMGLETGWIFLKDPENQDKWAGHGYSLVAHHNLPPALDLENPHAWYKGCDCQGFCNKAKLTEAYNEVECSRLEGLSGSGDTGGLTVHASVPMYAGEKVVGILNVAATDWSDFSAEALDLLSLAGIQMGEAIERAWLYDRLRDRRAGEQALLLELSNQLLEKPSLDDMVCCLIDNIRIIMDVDAGALLLPDEYRESFIFRIADGWQVDPVASGIVLPRNAIRQLEQAIEEKRAVVVQDVGDIPQWLAREQFASHIYVPLIANRDCIGVLTLNNRQPRDWTEDDLRLAQLLANQAAIAIEKDRLHEQELKRERLERELELGREMQLRLLPKHAPEIEGWDIAAFYQGARLVSGDFYDFFWLSDTKLGMVIADVADKGVPAALIMSLSRTMLRTAAFQHPDDPQAALHEANRLMFRDNDSNFFITCWYSVLDVESGELIFSNAGHNPPFAASDHEVMPLHAKGTVLGIFEQIPLERGQIDMAAGDVVVFYTDGVTEAMNPYYEEFGEEGLQRVIENCHTGSAQDILQGIVRAVREFTGDAPQSDDLTLFVVKRN
ncbi:MAG: SpoIIE family protein phosphatase [Chloroflexi bacterium]|nr:SpoIIE family protein phosphatase [Chloroflexota bacterium]